MTCMLDEDEADIEADIQRELDALGNDLLQIEDLEEDSLTAVHVKENEAKDDGLPDSIQEYLRFLHSRTEGAEEEVRECELILKKLPPDGALKDDEALLTRRIKDELGDEFEEHPLILRDQVLLELEQAEIREEREKLAAESRDREENKFALDIIRPGVEEKIQALEQKAQQELMELEMKQTGKDQEREKWYQKRREEEEARQEREKLARIQRQVEFQVAQEKLLKQQQIVQAKLEMEAKEEERKLKEMEEKFEIEIRAIEEEKKKQNEAFIEAQQKEAQYQQMKRVHAATKIQKFYQGYRVRKQYRPLLEARKQERMKKRQEELDRIERVERKLREDAARKKLEDEKKRQDEEAEKARKREEEKRAKEEEKRKRKEEEKQRKVEEEKRIREEEKQKKEEAEEKQRKLELEKRIKEEEKQKKEEEAKQRKFLEEKRIREEKQREKEEEEKRKVLDEERKQREIDDKLKEAERKRKMEEEKKKADEELRGKQEEKKLKEEQIISKEEAKRKFEEDSGRKEEENKQKEFEVTEREVGEQNEEKRNKREEEILKQKDVDERIIVEQENNGLTRKTFEDGTKGISFQSEICNKQNEKEGKKELELDPDESKSPFLALSEGLEARRVQWLSEHLPWGTNVTAEERHHPVAMKSRPRRVFSASKHLPSLTEEQLLKSSSANTPLFRVQVIDLKGEPSCSMQSLSKCPELRSLTLQNCGLLAVEGLDNSKELQELHLEKNKIEAVNCRDLSKLEVISLANNNLASIHGLDGCSNVVSLDLCNNKITRIGDLSMCNKLQELRMENNQLINTKGLSCLTNLQHLDLSNNHLARVTDIERCMLLQTFNLQANNLQEPPLLTNCVLLRELKLDDNSISSLFCLSTAWLPLLQVLSGSQNSISLLPSLDNLISLETLEISNNLISDTDSLVPGLQNCVRLRKLEIEGNPVQEDPACRTSILKALPFLKILNGENLSGKDAIAVPNQVAFVELCRNQLQTQDDLRRRLATKEIGYKNSDTEAYDPEHVSERLEFMSHHYKERFELAVRHLLEHENFALASYQAEASKRRPQEFSMEQPRKLQNNQNKERRSSKKQSIDSLKQRHDAAVKIQALWKCWYIRHLIDINIAKWQAAVKIQSAWRGYLARSRLKVEAGEPWDPQRNSAAIVIQAHFRGQRVRRRLAEALRAAHFYDDGDEEEEFDYDEEVDLTAFDFDESTLEHGWTPSDTPQMPSRGPALKMPGQSSKNSKYFSLGDESHDPTVPKPRHAWRSADSPIVDANQVVVSKATVDQDRMSVTSGVQSHLSHRAEELSSEWGFQNSQTTELMLRRAKKMKYNPARRKKLLDPNKRLALFKRLEETHKLRDVKPPPTKKQPPSRVEYFTAREAMASHLASTSPATEQYNKEQMTYSWVHKQAVVHEDEEENIMGDRNAYGPENISKKTSPPKTNRSPVSLPQMDPAVLLGRPLPLISSPLFTKYAEQTRPLDTSPRRSSLSSEGRVRFPAIKTHSVPNLLAGSTATGDQPVRTEKSNSAGARYTRKSKNSR
ncbi:leucine-rich repeat and IQ domain-containing protein 1-like isoform X1 [Montipora foliosa]|uniref:leucine-rich repeat and IQ domain-containing protein 1-like isoform X1 n=1 Tax=Montipora foliosa TaxID=591990 RepID=UPI0035F190E6